MEQISNEEKGAIQAFIDSCDAMINGKFILADIKIMKILNMIASSEPLYRYIQECLIDFNFEREYTRSQVKNQLNGSNFTAPNSDKQLVAMVFSLLIEFDKKHIDFYHFINTNFATLTKGAEYDNFAKTLLVPFRDIIANHFGLNGEQHFETQPTIVIQHSQPEASQPIEKPLEQPQLDEEDEIWKNIGLLVDNAMQSINIDRKIKGNQKEQCLYALKSIKYSFKYKDMRIVSSIFMAVEVLTAKSKNMVFVLNEIKTEINKYYDLKTK